MKKILFPVLTLSVLFATVSMFQSCTKVANNLHFNLKMQTGSLNMDIPPTTFVNGLITYGPTTSYYNVDSFIKAQTGTLLGVDNIKSVKIVSVRLNILNPSTANNVQNLESCYAKFSSDKYTTPYQVDMPFIPDTYATYIDMPVDTTAELKSYLGTNFTYSVSAKMRRPVTETLHCNVEYAFNVEVQG